MNRPKIPARAPPENPLIVPATAGFLAQQVAGIWNRYGGFLLAEANRLAIDPAVALAVLAVESKGDPFGPDGRMTIRFETHIFYHYWGKEHEAAFPRALHLRPHRQLGGSSLARRTRTVPGRPSTATDPPNGPCWKWARYSQ